MKARRNIWNFTVNVFCLILSGYQLKADVTLLSRLEGDETVEVNGNAAETDRAVTPASTFKIPLSALALEEGWITPETAFRCADEHIPGTPRLLQLHEAMFYSSNDYLLGFEGHVTVSRMRRWVEQVKFGQWTGKAERPEDGWHAGGGFVRITPRQQHDFFQRLMAGKMPWKARTQTDLLEALRWPDPKLPASAEAWGKTGSMDGLRWFTGAAKDKNGTRIITVLLTHANATREEAIGAFVREAGRD
jgi:beta-lactamase class D